MKIFIYMKMKCDVEVELTRAIRLLQRNKLEKKKKFMKM